MGSVIQLPLFVSTESLSMALPALKHLWALEFLKLQSDSLIVLLVQMIRNHQYSQMQILLQVVVFFIFLPFSIVFFCLWLRKCDSFLEFLLCFFFLSTIKGSKCCLSVHVMSLCARVRPLQVVT